MGGGTYLGDPTVAPGRERQARLLFFGVLHLLVRSLISKGCATETCQNSESKEVSYGGRTKKSICELLIGSMFG
jgi:hypothetical protein